MTPSNSPSAALSQETIAAARAKTDNDPAARLARNAAAEVGIEKAALQHHKLTEVRTSMSNRLDKWPVTAQGKTGRCWLFASLNLMRAKTMEKMGVKEFEFSQNYAMFWEKFERANYFLQAMIDLADQPLDSRLVQYLLGDVLQDGGQWDMLASVYKKHGVVPKEVMPETVDSSATDKMNTQLRILLRAAALRLRKMAEEGASEAELTSAKNEVLENVYRILTISLGVPPQSFDWQWEDADGKFHRTEEMTPARFYEEFVGIDLNEYVCLVDDPRKKHAKGATMTVEYLGDVVGGQPIRYLNCDISLMKELAAKSILEGTPVWFGCDVGAMSNRDRGLMVDDLYDYSSLLGVDLTTTKEERVLSGQSLMTHAMLLVGVDLVDGKPRRWRVENSWGDQVGDKGYFTMDDAWFTEYVFEVVVKKSELPQDMQEALQQEPIVLPAWDPMGSLA